MELTRETLIKDTCLNKRIKKVFSESEYRTVGELIDMNPFDIANKRGLGEDSFKEIIAFVTSFKFDERLNENTDEIFVVKDEIFIPCYAHFENEISAINIKYVTSITKNFCGETIVFVDNGHKGSREYTSRIEYDKLIEQLKEL